MKFAMGGRRTESEEVGDMNGVQTGNKQLPRETDWGPDTQLLVLAAEDGKIFGVTGPRAVLCCY